MKLCIIRDPNSPIAAGWVGLLEQIGYRPLVLPLASRTSPVSSGPMSPGRRVKGELAVAVAGNHPVGQVVFRAKAEILRRRAAQLAREVGPDIESFNPDVVHALRIPVEGLAAGRLPGRHRLAVSTWGNDLTLYAARVASIGAETRRVLTRAQGLVADCHRDARLARKWGWSGSTHSLVVPANGGLLLDDFVGAVTDPRHELGVPDTGGPLIVNPRGAREYIPLEPFFAAAEAFLRSRLDAVVACVGLRGVPSAERRLRRSGLEGRLVLLPSLPGEMLLRLFRFAHVSVSLSLHDGIPNTLVESMLAGCVPVVNNLESVTELVEDGSTGFVARDLSPEAVVKSLQSAVEITGPKLEEMRARTRAVVLLFADRNSVATRVQAFYDRLLSAA